MPSRGVRASATVAELERRGELFAAAPGVVGLRGGTLAAFRDIEACIASVARAMAPVEWMVPAAVSLETLVRSEYFAAFPQWLTTVSHLVDDDALLERVAIEPERAVVDADVGPRAALPPAVCYHTYAALAGRSLERPFTMTAQCTCWRHEGERTASLERGWAFTMREAVILGSNAEVAEFQADGMARAVELADAFGLDVDVVEATDPFFAPTGRGRALLQQVKSLKHELGVRLDDDRPLAIASFNHHETFFGSAFDIRLRDESPAASGCVAFGLERWLLAIMCVHGPDVRDWPAVTAC